MTDRPGRRLGQQGREELSALSDEDLNGLASQFGVATTNDDGTARDRDGIINELANKQRQAERGQPQGVDAETEAPPAEDATPEDVGFEPEPES